MSRLVLNRRIQFERAISSDNGLEQERHWEPLGSPVWADREDASDAERALSGWLEAQMVSRFTVRSSAFSRGLTPKDRLTCDGVIYEIQGIKQLGKAACLEITAIARADR